MYVVKKPLNLRGKRRVIGEIVGEQDVDTSRVYFLVRAGYLAEIDSRGMDVAASVSAPSMRVNVRKSVKAAARKRVKELSEAEKLCNEEIAESPGDA